MENEKERDLRRAKRRAYYHANKEKLSAAVRDYYHRNRDKVLAENKVSHLRHRDKRLAAGRKKYWDNREVEIQKRKDSYALHRPETLERQRAARKELRRLAFEAYGGVECQCCKEKNIEFLGIDHINGGGNKHRSTIRIYFYKWLRDQGYPSGYRVLCHNCNMARAFYGKCPHES